MAPFKRPHTSSYPSSIVNMSLSSTVTKIFSIKYWHDVEIWVTGSLRSLKIVPIIYDFVLVCRCNYKNIALSYTIFELFNVKNIVTLKSRLRVIEGHSKWNCLIDHIRVPIHLPL